jgi:CubicO group peptidase (beta-lactamase class C family)
LEVAQLPITGQRTHPRSVGERVRDDVPVEKPNQDYDGRRQSRLGNGPRLVHSEWKFEFLERIKMQKTFLCCSFVFLLAACAGQSVPAPSWTGRVNAIAESEASQRIAGVSIAVAQNGRIVFARGYGFANLEHSVPVSPETVFHIASISKNIEAGAILQLMEQGKLKLDDEVTKYVPEAPVHGKHVTLRQLLNHTSGIYSFTSLPNAGANERLDLSHEQVLGLIKDMSFDFEPGSSWRYDNSGFYLAGMAIEKVTGTDYGTYVREHVFQPLAMMSAQLCYANMLVPRLASPYKADHGRLVPADPISWKLPFAAGAVCGTASDLLKWQMSLDEGRFISRASVALMQSPTILTDGTEIDYGLGTRLGRFEGHRVFGHTGGGGGFTAVLESFPDDRVAIAVLINTGDASATSVAAAIARAIFNLPDPQLQDMPVPEEELKSIPGQYDSDEGPVELFAAHGRIHYRLPGGKEPAGDVYRKSAFTYRIDANSEAHFLISQNRARWVLVYTGGLMLDAKLAVRKEP